MPTNHVSKILLLRASLTICFPLTPNVYARSDSILQEHQEVQAHANRPQQKKEYASILDTILISGRLTLPI